MHGLEAASPDQDKDQDAVFYGVLPGLAKLSFVTGDCEGHGDTVCP